MICVPWAGVVAYIQQTPRPGPLTGYPTNTGHGKNPRSTPVPYGDSWQFSVITKTEELKTLAPAPLWTSLKRA